MTDAQIIQMIRDAGSIDSDETILTVYAAIRSATKEEDADICDELEMRNTRAGPADCGVAIRISK
jgi:hypothetical protein